MEMIGICGKARSGKDTMAERLVLNYGYTRYAFADPLKAAVNEMYGWDERHGYGELKEVITSVYPNLAHDIEVIQKHFKHDLEMAGTTATEAALEWHYILKRQSKLSKVFHVEMSPRQAYQWFGTEWGRNYVNPNLWLNKAVEFARTKKGVVIADVRFENEARFLTDNGYPLVQVVRPNITEQINAHSSEAGIDPALVSCIIDNSGSLEDFEASIDLFMKEITNEADA